MKNILVLTDFSRNAAQAAESAAWLAEKMHAGLLLWHCGRKVPVMPGYLGDTLVAATLAGPGEGKELLDRAVISLSDFISVSDGNYNPRLAACYREGKPFLRMFSGEIFPLHRPGRS